MLPSDLLHSASSGLLANKGRAVLTMLGIIIGVGSVVLMVSIGNSFQHYILTQIENIGTNTIDIFPVGLERFGGNIDSLTFEDAEAISRLSTVTSPAPVVIISQVVSYGREQRAPLVFGTTKEIFENYGLHLADGRLLDDRDNESARYVAVVSSTTAEELFGDADPIGKKITIAGFSFTVVGTLRSLGSLLLQDLDTPVYVPFSTARAVTGQRFLSFMNVRAASDPQLAIADIRSLLRQRHSINNPTNDPDKDDFNARSAEQVTAIVNSVTLGLTVFLGVVAGISLLVGGIGIMNIMLVAVTERTREIGLRKAVGAQERDILLQFLLEAVALTVTGGIIGIVLGGGIGWILAQLASQLLGTFDFILSIPAIIVAILMAAGTGLLFGIYPAQRAAALHPIEALRYE